MADQQWKKNLGFLESIMFDPVTSGILGLGEGIMSLFGVSEKNSQIDSLKNDYEKMKFTEDQMARRQSDVKRLYGNQLDSMNGAAGLLNGNVYKSIQVAKQASETAKGILDQRMKDEQVNLGITDKINQLEGQKSGYIPAVANTIAQTAQGIFGAVQASMGMDRQEAQDKLLADYMNPNRNTGTATGVTNPVTGDEVYMPQVTNTSNVNLNQNIRPNNGLNLLDESIGKLNFNPLTEEEDKKKKNPFVNWYPPIREQVENLNFDVGSSFPSTMNLLPNINSLLRPHSKSKKQQKQSLWGGI